MNLVPITQTHMTVQISVYKVIIMIHHSVWSFINDWTLNVKWFLQQYEHIWCDARIEVLRTLLLKIQVFCDIRNCYCWCCKDHSAFIFRVKQSILLTLLASQDEGSSNLEYKNYSTNNTVSHSRRLESSATPLWEPQNLTATSLVLLPHASKRQFLTVVSDLINLTWMYILHAYNWADCKLPNLYAATHGTPPGCSCQHQMHSETCTSARHHPPNATDDVRSGTSRRFQPVESPAIQDDQIHCLQTLKNLGVFSKC